MNAEKLIVEALEYQADSAPDSHRVLHSLRAAEPTTQRKALRRTGFIAVAAAVVAAAVVVPNVVRGGDETPEAPPPSMPAAMPPQEPNVTQPSGDEVLRYQPGWLPDGLAESTRGRATQAGETTLTRNWRGVPAEPPAHPALVTLNVAGENKPLPHSEPVDINGRPGALTVAPDGGATVKWSMPTGAQLTLGVHEVPDEKGTAIRIARSMTDTGREPYRAAMTVNWLPFRAKNTMEAVGAPTGIESDAEALNPEIWSAHTTISGADRNNTISITLGEDNLRTWGGYQLPVRDRLGSYLDGRPVGTEVFVEVDGGRWLSASGNFRKEELVQVLNGITVEPAGPLDGIGNR